MKIYVGQWELLPEEWEGINGMYDKKEEEILAEISRQCDIAEDDLYIAVYTPQEFEETFNHTLDPTFSPDKYFIKIF